MQKDRVVTLHGKRGLNERDVFGRVPELYPKNNEEFFQANKIQRGTERRRDDRQRRPWGVP